MSLLDLKDNKEILMKALGRYVAYLVVFLLGTLFALGYIEIAYGSLQYDVITMILFLVVGVITLSLIGFWYGHKRQAEFRFSKMPATRFISDRVLLEKVTEMLEHRNVLLPSQKSWVSWALRKDFEGFCKFMLSLVVGETFPGDDFYKVGEQEDLASYYKECEQVFHNPTSDIVVGVSGLKVSFWVGEQGFYCKLASWDNPYTLTECGYL